MPAAPLQPLPGPCRVCRAEPCTDLGPIFHVQHTDVGGIPIDLGDLTFRLRRCETCGFVFKDPPVPQDLLLACYAQISESHWGEAPDPHFRHFDTIRTTVERLNPRARRILDIGCNNGALLSYFGEAWDRCGIEPSVEAAALARKRGLRILGPTIESAPRPARPEERFDVIVCVDVLEHIPGPVPFFQHVAAHLRDGGHFIAVTGDTDALTWRLERGRYYYCTITEHVSFYSQRSMGRLASLAGMRSVRHQRTAHAREPLAARALANAKNAAFLLGFWSRGLGIPALQNIFLRHHAPSWGPARDHMLHIMERIAVPSPHVHTVAQPAPKPAQQLASSSR